MTKINKETEEFVVKYVHLNDIVSQLILNHQRQVKILNNVSRSLTHNFSFSEGYFIRARVEMTKLSHSINSNITNVNHLRNLNRKFKRNDADLEAIFYDFNYVENIIKHFILNIEDTFKDPNYYSSENASLNILSLLDQHQYISDRLNTLENKLIHLTYDSTNFIQANGKEAISFLSWFSLGTFLLSIGCAMLLANKLLTKPIKEIVTFWGNLQDGSLDVELDVHSHDEIGELAKASRSYHDTLRENRVMQREVQEAYSRLAFSINSMRDGFVVYDKDDRLVMVNQAFINFYECIQDKVKPGVTYEYLVRESYAHGMWNIGDRDPEEWIQSQLQSRKEDTFEFETEGRLADGRIMLRREHRNASGQIVGIRIDVTEMRKKEEELNRHKENLEGIVKERTAQIAEQTTQLEEALLSEQNLNEMQRQFVSMASHEFRTPLAIIDSSAQRLLRKKDKLNAEDLTKRINIIIEAVQRMSSLMESTLSAARMNAEKLTITPSNCNISRLIESVCVRHQELSPSHTIKLNIEDLPKTIQADKPKIDQVLTNLLSNAVKYAPDAPLITISGVQEKDDILISVNDQGLGIDKEDLPQMFQQFFRAKTSTGIAGTGIGLNIVKQIISEHGGDISIISEVGLGTTFTVRLPIAGPMAIAA